MWKRIFRFRLRSGEVRIPQVVWNYLLPHEELVIVVRRHPGKFIGHISLLACCCLAASLLTALTNSGPFVLGAAWGACFAIFLWLVIRAYAWPGSLFVVTDIRMIFISSRIRRKVISIPLREVAEFTARRRSRISRLMGYGEFIAISASQGHKIPKMNYMPYPYQIMAEIRGLLSPELAGDAEDYR
jgi:hypothetical protein